MIDLTAEIPLLITAAVELMSAVIQTDEISMIPRFYFQGFSGNGGWELELMNSKGMMLEPVPGTPCCGPAAPQDVEV